MWVIPGRNREGMQDYGVLNHPRFLTVAAFSLLFAYLLSFLFEGPVLYSLLDKSGLPASSYILTAILFHFAGLFSCGFFVKTIRGARKTMAAGMLVSLAATLVFFLEPSYAWLVSLAVSGYAGGLAVASWGWFLRAGTPKKLRLRSCADVLIVSNLIMIGIGMVTQRGLIHMSLALSLVCLAAGAFLTSRLSLEVPDDGETPSGSLLRPLVALFFFVAVITINSGLMYQVVNPAFAHLSWLTSWYWALPYIAALLIIRSLPVKTGVPGFLYGGMAMMIGAFLAFMVPGRDSIHYIVVDTLLLGACGIFDLFWWSILGEMLSYGKNPVAIFGTGLAANVFGVLLGDMLGISIRSMGLRPAEVTVIALTVVCVTLSLLPPLNRQLLLLLKNHLYLSRYSLMDSGQQAKILHSSPTFEPLTGREQEVLQEILAGKSNREIARTLFISESTVKTHARNIYGKYDVGSRAELISILLRSPGTP